MPCRTRLADLSVALAVAGCYFVADNLLNKIALGDGWQIFWPLNGITIALLIMRPRSDWLLLQQRAGYRDGLSADVSPIAGQ